MTFFNQALHPDEHNNQFLHTLKRRKLLIGMVHLQALPGSPNFNGDLKLIGQRALTDAQTLAQAGFDAIIVENFGDVPFYPDSVPSETVAAMTAIVVRLCDQIRLPIGVNVLRNDAIAALSICAVTGAQFIRTNIHTGAILTDQGIIQGRAHAVLRHRRLLGHPTAILADIAVKHGHLLVDIPLSELVAETESRGLADGLIVTGKMTGTAANITEVECARKSAARKPVLVGSGVSAQNLERYWPLADGFIVGTALKENNLVTNPVETARAEQLVAMAEQLRRT